MMNRQNFFTTSTALIVILSGFSLIVKGQFPVPKQNNIKLITDTSSTTVVYELNSVKFFFRKDQLLKQLKSRLNEDIYKEMAARGEVDSNYNVLLKALMTRGNKRFYIKDNSLIFNSNSGTLKKESLQNYYELGINELMPYILVEGNFALLDRKRSYLVKKIIIRQNQTYDFIGLKQTLTLYYPNGKRLFSITNRQSKDGNDLINSL